MKKFAAILLTLSLICSCALAQELPENVNETISQQLSGTIVEIGENDFLLDTAKHGEVLVLLQEDTYFECTSEISCGDYVFVTFPGQMTFSLPPQISAETVKLHRFIGEILEYDEETHSVLLNSTLLGEVSVTLPSDFSPDIENTRYLMIYFDGVLTASLPAKLNAALALPCHTLRGTVTQINRDYLLLGENEETIQINFTAGTLPQCLSIDTTVQVIYNGQMTRSLPPQVYALEIMQLSR